MMKSTKSINLFDLCSLDDDEGLSKKYLSFKLGFGKEKQYRHSEISDIKTFVSDLSIPRDYLDGFIYSYTVPQLNKEFDLIKISDNSIINIEIKRDSVPLEKKLKQIKANRHYLKLLGKNIYSFSYDVADKRLLKWSDEELIGCEADELVSVLRENNVSVDVDLDETFSAKNVLVSPLNDTERFVSGNYLLTENQENIKDKILDLFKRRDSFYAGVYGNAGTGKTLLLYDMAKELSKNNIVTVIHCGKLCEGHLLLNKVIPNLKIIDAKTIKYMEFLKADIVLVDEAHRIYKSSLEKVNKWAEKSNTFCVFSYDERQILSKAEEYRNVVKDITDLCGDNIFKLGNKIRTNKALNAFVQALFNLGRIEKGAVQDNVSVEYAATKQLALDKANSFKNVGYEYISFTPSFYDGRIDWQGSETNTHKVIGQEFDSVVMILDDNFHYEGNVLKAKEHPNPDYLFTKLLYLGLTRARTKIALVVTDKPLLEKILTIFDKE